MVLRKIIASSATSFAAINCGCTVLVRVWPKHDINRYPGQGEIDLLIRHNAPELENHGYVIQLPTFTPEEDIHREYSLSGLPLWDRTGNIEIVTLLLFQRNLCKFKKQILILQSYRKEHSIRCRLFDEGTGKMLQDAKFDFGELKNTRT